ncbi:MAG: 3-keto-disaccharide hydrolase [Thermoguttaceae bacterium]
MKRSFVLSLLTIFTLLAVSSSSVAEDWRSGIRWKKPPVVTPGNNPGDPPADAVILLGEDFSAWNGGPWTVEEGVMTVKPGTGDIRTKQDFGSVQLHLEFATPEKVEGEGQGRGNSGVFFIDTYEVQILDSYENDTYYDGQCASIYKQRAPIVNACKQPGDWQTYDIIFHRPELKIEDGKVIEVVRPAYVTVLQNGLLVIDHHEFEGTTFWHTAPEYEPHGATGPIRLQDHGNPIRFRNIWVREIPDTNAKPPRTREPYFNR